MQFFVSLLTIIMSGVAATAVTYLLNSRKEQVFFMRKKAEDLYLATEGFDKSLSAHFVQAIPLLKGELDYNSFHELVIDGADKTAGEKHNNVLMLVQIYFPEVEPEFEAWMAVRGRLTTILTEHSHAYRTGPTFPGQFMPRYDKALDEFDRASNRFKDAIVQSARRLTHPDALWPKSLTWDHWRVKFRRKRA